MQDNETQLLLHAKKTAQELAEKLKKHSLTLALAESCTAGLASSLLAEIPGASQILWGCYVCYTKEAKISMLDLDNTALLADGLVSGETASSMAAMALQKSGADIAASVTGLAGPQGDGGGAAVGAVWTAAARKGNIVTKGFHFTGGRNEIRLKAAAALFNEILKELRAIEAFSKLQFLKKLL